MFEFDHPVTQRKKLRRIERARPHVPPNHHLIEADPSRVSTVDGLAGSGFDRSHPTFPTFMSLLGVVYHLTPDSLVNIARSVSEGLPTGTRLIIDFLMYEGSCSAAHLELRQGNV